MVVLSVVMVLAWMIETAFFLPTAVGTVVIEAFGGARPCRLKKPRFIQCMVGMVSFRVVAQVVVISVKLVVLMRVVLLANRVLIEWMIVLRTSCRTVFGFRRGKSDLNFAPE